MKEGEAPICEVWTIGHSTRTLEQFCGLLKQHEIAALADVRRFPGSRRHPHFNQRALSQSIGDAQVQYVHFPELGGRRRARPDSPNTAWRNEGFRGYADYMMSDGFRAGIERLVELATAKRTALMCAEALWWQCHRALIADYLKAIGCTVRHILSESKTELHRYTAPARVVEGRVCYTSA